jgi:hypothetical protein
MRFKAKAHPEKVDLLAKTNGTVVIGWRGKRAKLPLHHPVQHRFASLFYVISHSMVSIENENDRELFRHLLGQLLHFLFFFFFFGCLF